MRVFISKKEQKELMTAILTKISVKKAASLCNLSERTIRDWRRGKFSIDLKALRKLCKRTKIPFPVNAKLKNDYWYTSFGSSAGGLAVYKKYGRIGGDPEYRKKKWYEWWEKEGKFVNRGGFFQGKPIRIPKKSVNLAEFVGIVLGDGNISQCQVTITLNSEDDREYSKFVVALVKKLFNVPTGTYHKKDTLAMNFIISRTALVRFCTKELGLKKGNKIKQQVDIPEWVKQNKLYSIACVRGLVDTDGCIFTHSYRVSGKTYKYKKLVFTSYSKPLRQSVFNILSTNGLKPRLAAGRDVRLDSIADMKKYFKIFSFHNSKNLKRYKD